MKSTKSRGGVLSICVASLLTACSIRAHVPDHLQGNTPLVVANATEDNVCKLVLTEAPARPDPKDSWLGMGGLSSHSNTNFNVKPGTYNVWAQACGGSWEAVGENVAIDGPAWIEMGAGQTPAASYKLVVLTLHQNFNVAPSCGDHSC